MSLPSRDLNPDQAGGGRLRELFSRVARLERGNVGAWQNASLASPWANYDTLNWTGARYRRVGDTVELEGLVATPSNVTPTVTIFTLPVGYRPVLANLFPAIGFVSGQSNMWARIHVTTAGLVQLVAIGDATGAVATPPYTVGFVSLACSFAVT